MPKAFHPNSKVLFAFILTISSALPDLQNISIQYSFLCGAVSVTKIDEGLKVNESLMLSSPFEYRSCASSIGQRAKIEKKSTAELE